MTFLMIARLLRDKGVYEYVEAARMVKREHPQARFVLVGPFDPNPAAVRPGEVAAWVQEGVIEYRGAVQDVRPEIAACHVFVLPSYREGTPRTVLEAMAMCRAIVTTDVPGCRQAVEDGVNGWLVGARESAGLVSTMTRCVAEPRRMLEMGTASRRRAELMFDSDLVAATILEMIRKRCSDATSFSA